jgi:hypothetical protein
LPFPTTPDGTKKKILPAHIIPPFVGLMTVQSKHFEVEASWGEVPLYAP